MNINLIFGNRKSGTTLLARLIDSEHIYVGSSETNFHHLDKVKSITKNKFSYNDFTHMNNKFGTVFLESFINEIS